MIRVALYHQPSNSKTVWFSKRNFRKLNLSCFIKEMQVMSCYLSPENSADDYAEQIRANITNVLDHLAPIRKYSMRPGTHDDKWLSSDAKNKKIRRRKLESCYKKTGNLSDKKLYRIVCRESSAAIHKSRCSHYKAKLNSAYGNQKETWNIAKKLLHSNSSKTKNTIPEAKCNIIGQYFIHKLEITPTDVSKIIKALKPKTSPLDFIPTYILKSCSELFSPIIAHLANLSFKSGIFPALYKLALSRLLPHHLTSSINFNPLQSGFRSNHSTETALLKIRNDIMLNIDDALNTILLSLYISSAFDTIDHSRLISRNKDEFGVTDIALKWLTAYLHSRKSFVSIGSTKSRLIASSTGVPQGSVLGPFLFSMFVSPIHRIIAKIGTNHHQYADNTQLYTVINPGIDSINEINVCGNAVTKWFLENGLLLNPNKTEAVLFRSRKQNSKHKNY
ncbi:uncharacterized protein LOC136082553 [Hydra vulgaris]|uniref:Uncharacterized protein LOC136082553 n=1 Tax=Hydra vulgaris TaxID=6087 RepID=A0ABM4C8T8_HYDVU